MADIESVIRDVFNDFKGSENDFYNVENTYEGRLEEIQNKENELIELKDKFKKDFKQELRKRKIKKYYKL